MIIDYQSLIDEAMLGIVKKILKDIMENGLVNDQSFYISFHTDFPEVILSQKIKKRYPKEITIVLQHQFKNLVVFDDKFSVNITFNGIPETISVPFVALTSFLDPLANFSLQFKQNLDVIEEHNTHFEVSDHVKELKIDKKNTSYKKDHDDEKVTKQAEVIAIDKFRKKK
ncbi:MAG: aminotransferase [Rickettsiales bacterium]|nr:MAG: aminotransferase [Rickettsiales bacterium]